MFSGQLLFDTGESPGKNRFTARNEHGGDYGVAGIQPLEQANKHAADLYWLAFLLTGHSGPSVDLAVEVIDSRGDESSFFSAWMIAWSRRVVIAKALSSLREELAESVRRTASRRVRNTIFPPRSQDRNNHATKPELERALMAIDVFPRCAVLLCVFEGMSRHDAAILLDADPALVRKAQVIGLQELTKNLTTVQGWASNTNAPKMIASETRHAEGVL